MPSQAALLFLSHADTDLLTLHATIAHLPADFSEVRVANFAHLQTQGDIDSFLNFTLSQTEMVIVQLLGGRPSFAYGIFEMRIHFGLGYRIYFGFVGKTVILLLVGSDKGDPGRVIAKAKQYWDDYQRRKSGRIAPHC